jgi:osmotically-inducible protein OsmY
MNATTRQEDRPADYQLTTRLLTALAAVILFLSVSPPVLSKSLSDSEITTAIQKELRLHDEIPSNQVDISTRDGIVRFTGTVENLLQQQRLTAIAETIKGVRSVVNRTTLSPIERSDSALSRDVDQSLGGNPATEGRDIEPVVSKGVVVLSGVVSSWQEKQLAGQIASSIAGVVEVDNELAISHPPERSDEEVLRDIRERMASDVWVDDGLIVVGVTDGAVTLSGRVGSAAERTRATIDAWVSGTRSVNTDSLEVVFDARESMVRDSLYAGVPDTKISDALYSAFAYDPRVSPFPVNATVDSGVVTLTGTVSNLGAKLAAAEDALSTLGVWDIQNEIAVHPEIIPPDDSLKDAVTQTVRRDAYLYKFDITVTADKGIVYLDGKVNTPFEREHAAEVASQINGVIGVVNLLESRRAQIRPSDRVIKENVESRLVWSPWLNAQNINVAVDGGIITLTGTVNTWAARHEAEQRAFEAGATEVHNRLKVKYLVPAVDTPTNNRM